MRSSTATDLSGKCLNNISLPFSPAIVGGLYRRIELTPDYRQPGPGGLHLNNSIDVVD